MDPGRRAPPVTSMRASGRALTVSSTTAEVVSVSSSCHCRMGRRPDEDRKTHFQSSASAAPFTGGGRSCSIEGNIDSSSMRTTVVRFDAIFTCRSRTGRKPARVTRTVYTPGARFSPRKTPSVLVRKWRAAKTPGNSERTSTVAPSCGVPLESRTTPERIPEAGFGEACAALGVGLRHTLTEKANTKPKHRMEPCFNFLPPWRNVRRCLLLGRILHGKIRRPRNRRLGQLVGHADLEIILPGRKGCQRQ